MTESKGAGAEAEGRARAEEFRRDHRLGVQPFGDLVAVIEQAAGIDVAVLEAGADEHGLTMRDPDRGASFIAVARTRNPMRQRSTLAHELVHVLFEDWAADAGNWSARTPEEIRADAFAWHLLVPAEGLRDFLGRQQEVYSAPQLAARFGWSDQYHALQAESDQRRAPQRLLARAINGYALGVLQAQAIATLRGIPLEDAEADLREAGVMPAGSCCRQVGQQQRYLARRPWQRRHPEACPAWKSSDAWLSGGGAASNGGSGGCSLLICTRRTGSPDAAARPGIMRSGTR